MHNSFPLRVMMKIQVTACKINDPNSLHTTNSTWINIHFAFPTYTFALSFIKKFHQHLITKFCFKIESLISLHFFSEPPTEKCSPQKQAHGHSDWITILVRANILFVFLYILILLKEKYYLNLFICCLTAPRASLLLYVQLSWQPFPQESIHKRFR